MPMHSTIKHNTISTLFGVFARQMQRRPAMPPMREIDDSAAVPTPALLLVVLLATGLGGGAAKRPVLYPNYHLQMVGPEAAQTDIDRCIELARNYGVSNAKGDEIARDTVSGAAVGGATGAAVGAVVGDLGQGAGAGAAGGAAGALTRSIIRSDEPDPTYRRFVERCLREKGYEPIGWR